MGESAQPAGAITLDQFIALNDELAALVRAGVPLERGLIDAGRELQGRLGAASADLGRRMAEGQALPEAIAASRGMPDVYRAVVEAGIRSGRLSKALEGMASIARGYAEARRAVGMALLYPLIVSCLAYALALFFLTQVAPRFLAATEGLGFLPIRALEIMNRAGESAGRWAPIPPLLLGLLALRWAWSGRSSALDTSGFGRALGWVPVVSPMISYYRAASFADLLALLVEHHVPLDEAVRLAGEASGDRRFRESSAHFAETLRRGGGADDRASRRKESFPPLLSWMLTAGHRQGNLPHALRELASTYRLKARGRADFLKLAMPSICLLGIGVGAVAAYAVMVFLPMLDLWHDLAEPVNR